MAQGEIDTTVKYPVVPDGSLGYATSARFYLFGRIIVWDDNSKLYRYEDGVMVNPDTIRPCPLCGLDSRDYEGCDPCLGKLPGVVSACCGHGVKRGHIIFTNGVKIKGRFAVSKAQLPLEGKWW